MNDSSSFTRPDSQPEPTVSSGEQRERGIKETVYRRLETVHDLRRRLPEEPRGPCLISDLAGIVRLFPLGTVTRVGRGHPCEICLPDRHISKLQFNVARKGETFELVDAGSKNGTYVNGEKVTSHTLTSGDIITVGVTTLVFLDAESAVDKTDEA